MIARTAQTWQDWLAFVLVLVFCGLRASEVRALSWMDVDFGNDTITVLRRADRWGRIGQPKSAAGTRTIPIPQVVRDALKLGGTSSYRRTGHIYAIPDRPSYWTLSLKDSTRYVHQLEFFAHRTRPSLYLEYSSAPHAVARNAFAAIALKR